MSVKHKSSRGGGVFWVALAVIAGLVILATWAVARRHYSAPAVSLPATRAVLAPAALFDRLETLTQSSMHASRPVLLGSRDPQGPSCVTVIRSGDLHGERPAMMGDYNGGPGTTMATLYTFDRRPINSPKSDLQWHQTRLKTWLENQIALNRPAAHMAQELAEKSREFFEAASAWTALPDGLAPHGFAHREDWPGYCMTEVDQAIGRHDLAAVKQWSGELAAAAFSLDDLHAWLSLLCENHLRALAFQHQCTSLFAECEPAFGGKYEPEKSISAFPAGVLSLNGWGNYFEVERQAERLFTMPPDRIEEISTNAHLTPGSLWVTPGVRACFLKLEGALSPKNQETWDQAARTPYEHSYLINMLYRVWSADVADDLISVLRKFDAAHPNCTVGELMGVLMYRGHAFGGLEWADRFTTELRKASDSIAADKTDLEAFAAAVHWTNQFHLQSQYAPTFTLRDALEQKKLDCVRATDMIGAVYRNAGRPRFANVRISAGKFAHSVAALMGRSPDDEPRIAIADGLDSSHAIGEWPGMYFQGYTWPPDVQNAAHPYSAELYGRGIDNYIWLEGYIIRGPSAGTLMSAKIPYSTHHRLETSQKVFEGPYPR